MTGDSEARTILTECRQLAGVHQPMVPTDADLLAMASAFDLIPFNPRGKSRHLRELRVERRSIEPEAWAITSEGMVLADDGQWEFEPLPSARDDGFLARCRWLSARDAIAFAQNHMARYPTGHRPETDGSAQ